MVRDIPGIEASVRHGTTVSSVHPLSRTLCVVVVVNGPVVEYSPSRPGVPSKLVRAQGIASRGVLKVLNPYQSVSSPDSHVVGRWKYVFVV
jgi:hypothetical protein